VKPEAIPETVSTIASLGPWGLVVFVVVVLLLAVWKVAGKLSDVFSAHTEALKGIGLMFAEHKLYDEKLHAETRDLVREDVDKVKGEVSGLIVGLAQDFERAEQDMKTHVATEMKLARAGVSSPFQAAVRPARGSRPGG
jgi:hypothetical protein